MQQIGLHTRLGAGEQIQLHIKQRFSLGKSVDAFLLGSRLAQIEDRPEWDVTSYNWLDDGGVIINITIRDVDPLDNVQTAGIVTPAVIITAIVGLSLITFSVVAYRVVDRTGEIVDTPGGAAAVATVSLTMIALIALVGIYLWKRK